MSPGGNPQTGPFYVEGAEPDDMLVVSIREDRTEPHDRLLRKPAGTVRRDAAGDRRPRTIASAKRMSLEHRQDEGNRLPGLRRDHAGPPRAAAQADARVHRGRARAQGGDRGDYPWRLRRQHGLRRHDRRRAASCFRSTSPARCCSSAMVTPAWAQAEVAGTGVETSMDVEFTVTLVKKKTIAWPRLENDDAHHGARQRTAAPRGLSDRDHPRCSAG